MDTPDPSNFPVEEKYKNSPFRFRIFLFQINKKDISIV